ncbi:MAG TPA: hypothetical protein VFJ13_05840, partial [Paracoccaceae bacterium]|nr:hypothetical protein [Paracoccaceae bacterium]
MKRIAFILLWLAASPALANHPGDQLDEVMAEKEPAFEATDVPELRDLDLVTAEEESLRLDDLAGQIVVLSFVPEDCAELCAAQQAKLEKVREDIEVTPMRDIVTFLAVRPQQSIGAAYGDVA